MIDCVKHWNLRYLLTCVDNINNDVSNQINTSDENRRLVVFECASVTEYTFCLSFLFISPGMIDEDNINLLAIHFCNISTFQKFSIRHLRYLRHIGQILSHIKAPLRL